MKYWPAKPTADVADYLFSFVDDLEAGETLLTRVVTATGVTKVSDAIVAIDDVAASGVRVWLGGGTAGASAAVSCIVTTSGGRTYSATAVLRIGEEPVSLDEAKAQLRIINDTSEDALISSFIRSARAYVESESGFVFVRRQFVEAFNAWPRHIQLGRRPLVSIDGVAYQDKDGTTQAFTDYRSSQDLQRLSPSTIWPILGCGGSISVTYTAGFAEDADAEELQLARQAILLLVGHWHLNRETAVIEAATPAEVPFAARALIDRFRVVTV